MQISCLKSTDLNLIILAKNSVLGRGGAVFERFILFGFFFFLFFAVYFSKITGIKQYPSCYPDAQIQCFPYY